MRKSAMAVAALLAMGAGAWSGRAQAKDQNILEWQAMAGVPKAYTGATTPIRGIAGGGLPWVISAAQGELGTSGALELKVTGLVLDPSDPTVISRGLAGINPFSSFKAVVSCLSVDMSGNPVTWNQSTAAFPATTGPASAGGGDAEVETQIALPTPCLAPIVFVTSPTGAWFAVTGH